MCRARLDRDHPVEVNSVDSVRSNSMKARNLEGERFGRLVPTRRVSNRGDKTRWLCACDCGGIVIVHTQSLVTGNTKSCGCLQKENRHTNARVLPCGEASFNTVYGKYKDSARKRALEFDLSRDIFRAIVTEPCYYCGEPPVNVEDCGGRTNGAFVYSGIDRMYPSQGYIIGNVVPCCKTCNFAKRKMSYDEFLSWVDRVHDKLRGKCNATCYCGL